MTVAAGTQEYALGAVPVTGLGLSWSEAELAAALAAEVAALVFDEAGKANVEQILAEVAETEFHQEGVARVLRRPTEVEDWRVGEAIAEGYLTGHRACLFPWPDGRDERKSGSSLPGADLVGIHRDGEADRFAFGEVKTSAEAVCPPQAMYGRTGLKKQLEDLRDDVSIRDKLVEYLAHRAKGSDWEGRFQAAAKRYLTNNADVRLFGVLVRDVAPNSADLQARVASLTEDCPNGTVIELLGVYLPAASIAALGNAVVKTLAGGAA